MEGLLPGTDESRALAADLATARPLPVRALALASVAVAALVALGEVDRLVAGVVLVGSAGSASSVFGPGAALTGSGPAWARWTGADPALRSDLAGWLGWHLVLDLVLIVGYLGLVLTLVARRWRAPAVVVLLVAGADLLENLAAAWAAGPPGRRCRPVGRAAGPPASGQRRQVGAGRAAGGLAARVVPRRCRRPPGHRPNAAGPVPAAVLPGRRLRPGPARGRAPRRGVRAAARRPAGVAGRAARCGPRADGQPARSCSCWSSCCSWAGCGPGAPGRRTPRSGYRRGPAGRGRGCSTPLVVVLLGGRAGGTGGRSAVPRPGHGVRPGSRRGCRAVLGGGPGLPVVVLAAPARARPPATGALEPSTTTGSGSHRRDRVGRTWSRRPASSATRWP